MPTVLLTTVKFAICCWPDVTSVARICAGCVVALASAWMPATALPVGSVATVSVCTSGAPGLVVMMPNGAVDDVEADLPPRPAASRRARWRRTVAVPVWPEHRLVAAVVAAGRERQRVEERASP